jgi:IclR family acetate operon transcriptional repressor
MSGNGSNGSNGNGNGYQAPGVERCLKIMELLAENPQGLTLSELVEQMGVPKNGVFRVSMTMLEAGYLIRNEATKRFKLSKKMLVLGYSTVASENIVELSRDAMHSLREVTKETVCIGSRVDLDGVVLEQLVGLHPFKFSLDIGYRFPLYAGSPGKAISAHLPEDEFEGVLSRIELTRMTDTTITDKDELREEMKRIRECGYALDLAEGIVNCHCIGAPIMDHNNYPVAVLWTTGPAERMTESFLNEIAPVVVEHAGRISEKLGNGVGK